MKREEYISDETVVKRANEAVRIELEKKKSEVVVFAGPSGSRKEYFYRIAKTAYRLYKC